MNLIERSKQIILDNQDPSGAFVASPSFTHYQYSWLRDGTFIAYSLDCIGERLAAEKFFGWGARAIEQYRNKAILAIQQVRQGQQVVRENFLHARYTMDGKEVEGEWGTYQLDGYGTWLWGVGQHLHRWPDQEIIDDWIPTIRLIAEYLLLLWKQPNFDCWEEFGDHIHPSTIAAIYGGLEAVKPWLDQPLKDHINHALHEMKTFLFREATYDGRFAKSAGNQGIDSSLLWLHIPFQVVAATEPVMERTVKTIEEQLLFDLGLHRYPEDVYYGGGQWIILSAWLGWHYAEIGEITKARQLLQWVERQFDENGYLPEQVHHHMLAPEFYRGWIDRWGPPACPLLWSHAMHLILKVAIEQEKQ